MAEHLAYDDCGTGVPIVLLHGLTFDRLTWRPIVDRLADRVRTVAPDLPAHGDSEGPPGDLEDVALAVHDLVERLGVERPVVVGHSMSGGLALLYAATYPTRGAVMVDDTADVRPFAQLLKQLAPRLRGRRLRVHLRRVPAEHEARPDPRAVAVRRARPPNDHP